MGRTLSTGSALLSHTFVMKSRLGCIARGVEIVKFARGITGPSRKFLLDMCKSPVQLRAQRRTRTTLCRRMGARAFWPTKRLIRIAACWRNRTLQKSETGPPRTKSLHLLSATSSTRPKAQYENTAAISKAIT